MTKGRKYHEMGSRQKKTGNTKKTTALFRERLFFIPQIRKDLLRT